MKIQQIRKFKSAHILVIGDYLVDQYVNGDVNRISPEAPIPVVRTEGMSGQLGGAGNVVNNVQAMKGHARVLTCFGTDDSGSYLLDLLKATDADVSFVRRYDDVETIRKIRVTARGQQIVRVDFEHAKHPEKRDFVEFARENIGPILEGIDAVVVSDYGKGTVTQNLMDIVIPAAKSKSIPVLVDPKGKDWTKYTGATMCTPNLSEFSDVLNRKLDQSMEAEIRSEGTVLCQRFGMDYVLVTRSEHGMSLVSESGDKTDFPVKKRDVIDVSGAGDTVISTMALCISSKISMEDSCRIANAAASIAVSKFGTSPVTYDELYDLLSEKAQSVVVSADEIQKISEFLHSANRRIVFTNGCFDILHAGHVHSLEFAKAQGDVLVVGLNSDASVRRLKGETRPIVDEQNRAYLLKSLRVVDYVVIFDEDTPLELIRRVQPDVLVKGEDYADKTVVGQDIVEARGGEVRLVDLRPGLSTTNIVKKILEANKE